MYLSKLQNVFVQSSRLLAMPLVALVGLSCIQWVKDCTIWSTHCWLCSELHFYKKQYLTNNLFYRYTIHYTVYHTILYPPNIIHNTLLHRYSTHFALELPAFVTTPKRTGQREDTTPSFGKPITWISEFFSPGFAFEILKHKNTKIHHYICSIAMHASRHPPREWPSLSDLASDVALFTDAAPLRCKYPYTASSHSVFYATLL